MIKKDSGYHLLHRLYIKSLGFVLTSKGKKEEAKPALQKAIELDPNSEMGQEAKRILALLK